MEIREEKSEENIILHVSGEIDGTNVDDFESTLDDACERTESLILDLDGLEYVSSAGLRVFLTIQKKMKQRGFDMLLKNVEDEVMDIFSVTGFVKLLNIE
ncbi:MAG: STAS domain-containing protein [Eubacterium sp.]|nr:STAS domain-containing protein [Eubacterium sp.]